MSAGFFTPTELPMAGGPTARIAKCDACKLHVKCKSKFMPVAGRGWRKILVLGEQPSKDDDLAGRPFSDRDGQYLAAKLRRHGVDLHRDCWHFNALSCHGEPPPKAVEFCRPNVVKLVERLDPEVIIPLGEKATSSLLGWLWRDSVGPINRWVGFTIPHRSRNCWIVPNYSPRYVREMDNPVLDLHFDWYLATACSKTGRPWNRKHDFTKDVEIIIDPDKAAARVRGFKGGLVAFDFETNMLKPDHPRAKIVSCSLSNGKETIAFPWIGRAARDMNRIFFTPDVKKIASNLKMEDRWVRCKVGREVEGWAEFGDTMLTAHAVDNGEKASQKKAGRAISSIKFQALVLLGVDVWDTKVSRFLKTEGGGYEENRIDKVPLPDLLLYNGLDSLYEFLVHELHVKRIRNREV